MNYEIAKQVVFMNPKYQPLLTQSESYKTKKKETMADLSISEKELNDYSKNFPALTIGECEYMLYGARFYEFLINNGGFLLHSSCVVYEEYAYLFSAFSGVGKSTHTNLWVKHFKGAKILNDDKPAIVIENSRIYAYGTPFSGKTDLNINACYPIKAIIFLERGINNEIHLLSGKEAIYNILSQTIRPSDDKTMENLLFIINMVVKAIPIYGLKCNISDEAVELVYRTVNRK